MNFMPIIMLMTETNQPVRILTDFIEALFHAINRIFQVSGYR